jgi:hypothetical protein
MPRQVGTTPVHPFPLLLASPFTGVDGRLCREGWDPATVYPTTCRPHALHCGPLVGQCCTRRNELRQPPCFTESGILLPVRTLCRQRAPSPRRNTKRLWLPRNIAVMLPSDNTEGLGRATRLSPTPSAPPSRIRVPAARAPVARAPASFFAHANTGEIADCTTQTGGTRAPTARVPAA